MACFEQFRNKPLGCKQRIRYYKRVIFEATRKEIDMVKAASIGKAMARIVKDWKRLEDKTISLAEDLSKKSDNEFVRVISEIIRLDSQKHKIVQDFVINHLTKKAVQLTPHELIPLAGIIDKHIHAEAKSMTCANNTLVHSKDFFVNFFVRYLLDDEVKHHEMLVKLDQIKGQVYPYGTVRAD